MYIDDYRNKNTTDERELTLFNCLPYIVKKGKQYLRDYSIISYDDYIQEGLIGVLEALKTYRKGHNTTLLTYARQNITWKMLELFKKNNIRFESIDDNNYHAGYVVDEITPIDAAKLLELFGTKNKAQEIAYRVNYNDESMTALAKEWNVTPQAVEYTYKRGLERVRSAINDPARD